MTDRKVFSAKTAAALIILTLALRSGPAAADCRWPEVLDGSPKRSAHLHQARTIGLERAAAELLRKHQALARCLPAQEFFDYFASAALVIGRYGRRDCRWSGFGPGSDSRNEHLRTARALGRSGLTGEFARRVDLLAGCLDQEEFAQFYADLSLVQAEYGAQR